MSALNNCFPSLQTSMTVVLVLCCFVHRVNFRLTMVPLGAIVMFSGYALGIHWIADVIAGAAVGFVGMAIACRLADPGAPANALLLNR